MTFSDLMALASLIVGIISVIVSIIGLKPPNDSISLIVNSPSYDQPIDSPNDIEIKNNKAKLRLLYTLIYTIMVVLLIISALHYYNLLIVSNHLNLTTLIKKILLVLYMSFGITVKICTIMVPIISLAIVIKFIRNKERKGKILNITVFSLTVLFSIIFFILSYKIDYASMGNTLPSSDLTLYSILNNYTGFITIIEFFFTLMVLHKSMSLLFIKVIHTQLLDEKIKYYVRIILIPVVYFLLVAYWSYIL